MNKMYWVVPIIGAGHGQHAANRTGKDAVCRVGTWYGLKPQRASLKITKRAYDHTIYTDTSSGQDYYVSRAYDLDHVAKRG